MFFFFQAEDGIRDRTVTGVQTCALPIFARALDEVCASAEQAEADARELLIAVVDLLAERAEEKFFQRLREEAVGSSLRSEERRVGKEWRSGGAVEQGEESKANDRGRRSK